MATTKENMKKFNEWLKQRLQESTGLQDAINDGTEDNVPQWKCPGCGHRLSDRELEISECWGCNNKFAPHNMIWYGRGKAEPQRPGRTTPTPRNSAVWDYGKDRYVKFGTGEDADFQDLPSGKDFRGRYDFEG